MQLDDITRLINAVEPMEAAREMEILRQPDKEWMKQESVMCVYETFEIIEGQNRYTIEHEKVPFECLFLPYDTKKLYVMLSGGGLPPARKYPTFLRWKYKNFLKGNILCIDDPMYHFYPDIPGAMWYYGTEDVSYSRLLVDIVQRFMEKLNIDVEQVVFIGSSAGGTAALYCANYLDNSACIAINPQTELKDWSSRVSADFKRMGIDIIGQDKFNRNHLKITNKKSKFAVVMNAKVESEYESQFVPFFEKQGITPKFGITLNDNIITWIHSTNYTRPHSAVPCEVSMAMLDYLLKKVRANEDINELTDMSLLANQIFYEKYDLKMKNESLTLERNTIYKFFIKNISGYICDTLARRIPKNVSTEFREFLDYDYDISYITRSGGNIGYYIGEQQIYRYNILYLKGNIYFRLKFSQYSSYFTKKEELIKYLDSIKGQDIYNWHAEGNDELVVTIVLNPDEAEKRIVDFVDLTLNCIQMYF